MAFKTTAKRYYYLTKPGIIYGNLVSAVAGFLFACRWHIQLALLIATIFGVACVIGAACVFNNYQDRKIDRKMKRTRQRALAAGTVSAGSALAFGTVLGLAGFTLLAWRTNAATVVLGVIGFADYVILYGISKRRFSQGTLVGSISGAAPIAAGYTAVSGRFDTTALILFLIMVLWQMPHFYAIAMYRYNDYKQAGLPVLPVSRGNELAKRRIVYYIAALTAAIVALKLASRAGYVYLVICLAVNSYWLARAITTYSKPALEWGRSMFKYSLLVLCVFSAAIAFGSLLP